MPDLYSPFPPTEEWRSRTFSDAENTAWLYWAQAGCVLFERRAYSGDLSGTHLGYCVFGGREVGAYCLLKHLVLKSAIQLLPCTCA